MVASTTRGKYAVLPQSKEPGDPDERLVFLIEKAKSFFPKEYYPLWKQSCNKLAHAGYGTLISLSYARNVKSSPCTTSEVSVTIENTAGDDKPCVKPAATRFRV